MESQGLTRHRLDHLVKTGEYERVAPGLFLRAGSIDDATAARMAVAVEKPDATLCLISALALHDLTDEIPRSSHMAIPRGTHPMKVHHVQITWHRLVAYSFTIGLYSPERTIIDLFRLRHEWGSDLEIGALKRWLARPLMTPSHVRLLREA